MALGCRPLLEQSVPRHLIDFPEGSHKNIRIWEHPTTRRVAEQAANSVQCTCSSCLILDVISSRKSPHGNAEQAQLILPHFLSGLSGSYVAAWRHDPTPDSTRRTLTCSTDGAAAHPTIQPVKDRPDCTTISSKHTLVNLLNCLRAK